MTKPFVAVAWLKKYAAFAGHMQIEGTKRKRWTEEKRKRRH